MNVCKASDDRWLVTLILFILGMGTLLPWNFFITATGYFSERLNDPEHPDQADPYRYNNWSVLLAQVPLLLCTLLNSLLYQHITERMRICGSLVFILLLFILTASLVKVEVEQNYFFSITMATIWFINSFSAVLQGGLFGLVGKLPLRFSSVFMSGQAVAGIFAALAMLLCKIWKTDVETAALGYFITPCVATLVTLGCYLTLPHLAFARLHLGGGSQGDNTEREKEPLPRSTEGVTLLKVRLTEEDDGAMKTKEMEALGTKDSQTEGKLSVLAVFKKIWLMAACVTCVFAVTLSVFPAVTAEVKTTFTGKWEELFSPVCCFLVFNIMDWAGRSLTSLKQWPSKESRVFPCLVFGRVVFIPLFMLCNVSPRTHLPILFPHDATFTTIMALFALTNGYFACLCMSYAPQLVRQRDAETAGALMTFFLALGLSLGAALSFGFRMLV